MRVFGSVARGEASPNSDVDLLIHLEKGRGFSDLMGFCEEVEAALGRRVSLDSSAVVAILLREPGHEVLVEKLMGRPDHPPRPGKEAGLMRMHH